tara:strand:+ start:673 stop:837 length:165 start_codon:yes stop_codon:yes gene_type:complete
MNEVNLFSIIFQTIFGPIVDKVKEIIKRLKDITKKQKPIETIIVHQYKDYNNVE